MNWRVHILPAAVALVIGAGLIMLADRREVVRMEFVSMEPPVLAPGSSAIVTWKTNVVRTGCDGEVTRQIIDASNVVFTYSKNRTVINPDSVPTQFSGTFTVPVAAATAPSRSDGATSYSDGYGRCMTRFGTCRLRLRRGSLR
jgi:hypothetical protein